MPNIVALSEIKGMEDDMPVTGLKGKIAKVWKWRNGKDGEREWSFQDVELTDGEVTVTVTLKNREQLAESWKGKQVHILAKHGEKGWTGLRTKFDDYKKKNVVLMTPSAEIVATANLMDSAPTGAVEQPPEEDGDLAPQRPPARPAPAQRTAAQATTAGQTDSYRQARALAGKCLNAHKIAIDAAINWAGYVATKHGVTVPFDQVCTHATSIFIKLDRAGVVEELPTGPIAEIEPKSPKIVPPPEPPAEPATPSKDEDVPF
jgi:hypothetical protein